MNETTSSKQKLVECDYGGELVRRGMQNVELEEENFKK